MNQRPWLEILALLALAWSLALLLAARRRLRDTTLLWPWGWCLPTLVGWAAVVLWQLFFSPSDSALLPWRYAAGVLSLAPGVSLLGVRRPHHRAWQWVVVSLLGVLLLPLGHWALGASGRELRLHGAWRGFLGVLLLLQWLHYGLTRHAVAALFFGAAQVVWLGPALGIGPLASHPAEETSLACVLAALALGAAWTTGHDFRSLAPQHACPARLADTERLLRDFRLWFGDFWFQRLRWQVMLAAQRAGWPVTITPSGALLAEPADGENCGWDQAFRTSVEQFLRRFVSSQWIQQRTANLRSDASHDAVSTPGSR